MALPLNSDSADKNLKVVSFNTCESCGFLLCVLKTSKFGAEFTFISSITTYI